MPVNPAKNRKVLVIHGVQQGADKDQHQDKQVRELINNRLGNLPVSFSTELYRYEDINDKAIAPAKALMRLIGKTPKRGSCYEHTLRPNRSHHHLADCLNGFC